LDALVSRIQAASEVDKADLVPSRERINTEAFFASMQRDYEGDPDVRLELKVDQTGLYGDYDLLRQAVSNLISNAVKYSPKSAYIAITVARSAITGGVEIAIADQGRGIPAGELERVFEPYYRARNAAGVRGLGLGPTSSSTSSKRMVARFVSRANWLPGRVSACISHLRGRYRE
jgi:signal transduction histidine kinase